MDILVKRVIKFSLVILLIIVTGCGGEESINGSVVLGGSLEPIQKIIDIPKITFAKWLNNASYAVTFTFDDNLETHYTLIGPLLEEYNFRGSFFINPGRNRVDLFPTWEPVREGHRQLAARGHEIGSHSWTHLDLTATSLPYSTLCAEIEDPIYHISNEIGYRPVSFVHPYNLTNSIVDNIVLQKYLFTRLSSIHSIKDRLLMNLISTTSEDLIKTNLNAAVQGDKWLIVAGHGAIQSKTESEIVAGHGAIQGKTGWEPVTTNFLRKFCNLIKAFPEPAFVGTLAEVGAYEYLRQEMTIMTKVKNNQLQIVFQGFQPERYRTFRSLPITLILPVLNQNDYPKLYFDEKEIQYDPVPQAYIDTVDLTKQTTITVKAIK